MEVAATVIQAAGFRAVLAASFARSFYRNAINNGLLVVECDTASIHESDRLAVRVDAAETWIENLTRGERLSGSALPPIMLSILEHGGLVRPSPRAAAWCSTGRLQRPSHVVARRHARP